MKRLMSLMLIVASMALLPALIFAGPAAAAKGGNKARVGLCKQIILNGAAFRNLGQCVSPGGPNPGVGGGEPDINIGNQALLLSDNTIFLNDIDYSCPADESGTTILASVRQGNTVGFGTSPARCDGASHTANVDVGPGPFTLGVEATAAAQLQLPSGRGPTQGNTVIPRAPDPPAVNVNSHALLLTNGSVVLTVSYRCVPGSGGNTAGMLSTGVIQGSTVSEPNSASATCDDRFHPASTSNGPGPFSEGSAMGTGEVANSDGTSLSNGGSITISASG